MASRIFNRKQALEKEIKELYADVAIGAAGAPTLTKGLGITSVARTGAGAYTVTLDDRYVRLMSAQMTHLSATEEDLKMQIASETVSTTKTIAIFTLTGAVATDPASGDRLLIKVELKNSTAGE